MTLQEIDKEYNRIIGSLDCKELRSAFGSIQALIAGCNASGFQDKLNELQDTYKYMLRYRSEGIKDPMQEQIYNNLQTSAYELADKLKHKALAADSPITYYSRRRTLLAQQAISFAQLHSMLTIKLEAGNQAEFEAARTVLFGQIWVSGFLNAEDVVALKEIISDTTLPLTVGCHIVSSLILALQMSFDKEKLLLLFDAARESEEEVRTRAMIGILVTLYMYRKRTALYPQIENRLAALAEEMPGFTKTIRTITLRFILARETEKITRKLQNEIIPEMMKLSPKLSQKINLADFTPEQLGDEVNPEWQSMLSDSNLEKKMEEFSELQQEGADVMHSTFIHLKSFPFFRELSNWLLPFYANHSMFDNKFSQDSNEKQIISTMTLDSFMCNSDKYSFYFSLMQLPEEHRRMMMEQFDSQITEMLQQNKEELLSKQNRQEAIISQYIQDLYRFFKIYPGHLDFDDIFAYPLDFHNLPVLQPYISDDQSLTTIAEYYLRKNYFSDALVIFNRLITTNQESDILFQKIGYCKQMNDDLNGALDAYLHADLLNHRSKWVIRRIAGCYRTLKKPEEALKYYHRYEALSPENLSVQINIGHCHLELKNFNEALKCYFKVDYLDNKSHKAWRPIAWCSFLTGKYDQARNYYKKILEHQPNPQDLLNAGHTEWALQNIKGSLALYKQAVKMESGDFYKFQEQFNQDIPDLIVAGIEESEIPLMMDMLRYTLHDML